MPEVDFKVSRRERRFQPDGPVEVLMDNTCELYPIFDENDEDLIVDVEILDDDRTERLDRAMFAAVKQRGLDPLDPGDGVQWAEHAMGEVAAPVILQQVGAAVGREGPGVHVAPDTVYVGDVAYTTFTIKLFV
jgi:hypothetical protein